MRKIKNRKRAPKRGYMLKVNFDDRTEMYKLTHVSYGGRYEVATELYECGCAIVRINDNAETRYLCHNHADCMWLRYGRTVVNPNRHIIETGYNGKGRHIFQNLYRILRRYVQRVVGEEMLVVPKASDIDSQPGNYVLACQDGNKSQYACGCLRQGTTTIAFCNLHSYLDPYGD